jgi:sulfatase modifying factor 1
MVSIPGGWFVMGKDAGRKDERPAHRVHLNPFRAAAAPVTNAEYALFVEATGHEPAPFLSEERFAAPGQPVVGPNWDDAVAYGHWLTTVSGTSFRLPTEAERECAARGGTGDGDWPWEGADWSGHPLAATLAALDGPHEPLHGCANGYGLRCMTENVHEWCSDWYDPAYYSVSPAECPTGPATGRRKASRGGAWRHKEKFTRVNARSSLDPSFHYSDFGFRVYADG